MKVTEHAVISHIREQKLRQILARFERAGWKPLSEVFVDAYGFFSCDLLIEQKLVVFIDLDGVLVLDTPEIQAQNFNHFKAGQYDKLLFDVNCTQRLINTLERTGAVIKVHSRWRRTKLTESDFVTIFTKNGFSERHFHKDLLCKFRGFNSSVEQDISCSYTDDIAVAVVIDDRQLSLPPNLPQILTDGHVGFCDGDAKLLEQTLFKNVQLY